LEQGAVHVMSNRDSFQCKYYSPKMCVWDRADKFTVKTKSHADRLYAIGDFEALKEYNEFDTPRADICDFPPGSIYLELFLYPEVNVSSSSSGGSEPTITSDDDLPVVENYSFIRLPADRVEQSPRAQQAREYIYWALEECEKQGAPSWRD